MFKTFLYFTLLGWGAAIPIGPVNMEITRRNLQLGTLVGLALGFGACIADLVYLTLMSVGILQMFTTPKLLCAIQIVGSFIIFYFAYKCFINKPSSANNKMPPKSIIRNIIDGFVVTFFNAFNLMFWASISAQLSAFTQTHHGILTAGSGVMFGTVSWMVSLNLVLHFTRHKINNNMIRWLNIIGGVILTLFGLYGLARGIQFLYGVGLPTPH
ncbi:MAG: LysE family translocator [Parachlamydiales bacterium]|nr:LysE family translocator [Parachlamydiales bacterium]